MFSSTVVFRLGFNEVSLSLSVDAVCEAESLIKRILEELSSATLSGTSCTPGE